MENKNNQKSTIRIMTRNNATTDVYKSIDICLHVDKDYLMYCKKGYLSVDLLVLFLLIVLLLVRMPILIIYINIL